MKNKVIIIIMLCGVNFFCSSILFPQSNDEYYVVTSDYVNMRVAPDVNANILEVPDVNNTTRKKQLRITDVVKVLKKAENEIRIGNKIGRWAYIDTGSYYRGTKEFIRGWVFDYYLSGINDFSQIKSLKNNMQLEWADGDAGFEYIFYKNGRFKSLTSKKSGVLFIDKSNSIIIQKFDGEKQFRPLRITGCFFIKSDGIICVIGGEPPTYSTCAKIIK